MAKIEKTSFPVPCADGEVRIAAQYWKHRGERTVVLVHAWGATKESWHALADRLQQEGFDVLAIDLRGHGGSVHVLTGNKTTTLTHHGFSDEERQQASRDLEGAREYLVEHGVAPETIYVGGASSGGGFVIEYMAQHPECPAGFVLSPGLVCEGVYLIPFLKSLHAQQHLYVAVSEADEQVPDALEQAAKIYDTAACSKQIKTYPTGGHGTELLVAHPGLGDELAGWLRNVPPVKRKAAGKGRLFG